MFSIEKFVRDAKDLKLIRDPIYGFIEVPYDFLPILDHKLLQRLRWISQLPLEQLVYPSAQHSRFEHSIGTMYLSMQIAIALLKDELSRKRIFQALEEERRRESNFNIEESEKEKFFVYAAGLCGLLHDVGHAPFSHTLEEATTYTRRNVVYDHEKISFLVAKKILDDIYSSENNDFKVALHQTVVTVLNKSYKQEELSPLKKILRSLIDNTIDADKGDYLLRDSFHCGVIYGNYDWKRLWRNVRITQEFTLGVSPKGALEAWNLRLARFRMYKSVYKHHVRNITDALLIDILSEVFDLSEVSYKEIFKEILPISPDTTNLTEEDVIKFYTWTENEILRVLTSIKDKSKSISEKIDAFLKRKLPKRFLEIDLREFGIPPKLAKSKEVVLKVKRALKEIEEQSRIQLLFLIEVQPLPPVFTRDVQQEITIVKDSEEEQSLAEFLGFALPFPQSQEVQKIEKDLESFSQPSIPRLEIFADRNVTTNELEKRIKEKLRKIF